MVNSKEYKGYVVYSNGKIFRPTQVRQRSDGVKRTISGGWQSTRIRDADKGKGGGYEYVDLWVNGKVEYWLVHRLVAKLFVENPSKLPQVNHKDGNRKNNDYTNLEWVSPSDNQNHAYKVLNRKRHGKVNDHQAKEIWTLRNIHKMKLTDIASQFGISYQSVSRIALGGHYGVHKEDI